MTLFLSEHDAARLGIAGATPRQKRGRATRPDLPSAGRSPSTGLSTLLAGKGRAWVWCSEYRVGCGYRLYRIDGEQDTGYWESEKAVCDAAKAIEAKL